MNPFRRKTPDIEPVETSQELQGALAEVTRRIEECEMELVNIVSSRGNGEAYVLNKDAIEFGFHLLLQERDGLLERIDRKNRHLGRRALSN